MPIPSLEGGPATIVRGADMDADGNRTPPASVHVIEGCAWTPRTQGAGPSSQSIDRRGRQGFVEGRTFYAPTGADIVHTDQMILGVRLASVEEIRPDHELWEVHGQPGDLWNFLSGRHHGLEIAIRQAAG